MAISRLVVLLIFSADIWTRSRCRARTGYIGQAEVVLKDVVRAGEIGSEGNIRALLVGGGKALNNLGRWISHDFVATDDVVAGSVKEQNPVGVPSDIVFLGYVPAAAALEANTEIDIPACVVDAAVSVECRLVHPILVTVREAYTAARGAVRTSSVVDPNVFFEGAI